MRVLWVFGSLISILASQSCGQFAPTTRPIVPRSISSLEAKTLTAGGWLDLAVNHWQASLGQTEAGRPVPSPLMLIAIGQAAANDPGTLRTLSLLQTEADGRDTPASRAFAYSHLAMCYHQLGEKTRRNELLDSAMEAAKQVDSETLRPVVDLELITALARTGQFHAASALAHTTQDVTAKGAQFCAMALAADERGDQTTAQEYLRAAQRLVDGQTEEIASAIWCKVGQAQAVMGDFHGAVWSVQMIVIPSSQLELLTDLARRQRKADDSPGYRDCMTSARDAIERLPAEFRTKSLFALAKLQIELQDNGEWPQTIDTIKQAIEAMPGRWERAEWEPKLAVIYARAGDAAACRDQLAATQPADSGEHPATQPGSSQDQVALCIAALANAGKVDAAESLAKTYETAPDAVTIHSALAEAHASRGHFEEAVGHFDLLQAGPSRAWTARRIAAAMVDHRQFEPLVQFLKKLDECEGAWASLGAAEGLIGSPIIDRKNAEFAALSVD